MQLIGVSDQAEKDEVVKSVINLKKTDAEEGYTMEAAVARQVKTCTEFDSGLNAPLNLTILSLECDSEYGFRFLMLCSQ